MPHCAVKGCRTGYRGEKYYPCFYFPSHPGRAEQWKKALNRGSNFNPSITTRVCARHFPESHLIQINCKGKPTKRPHLVKWAYPMLEMEGPPNRDKRKGKPDKSEDHSDDSNDPDYVKDPLDIDDKERELAVKNEVIVMLQNEIDQLKEDNVLKNEIIENGKLEVDTLKRKQILDEKNCSVEIGKLKTDIVSLNHQIETLNKTLSAIGTIFNEDQIKRLIDVEEKNTRKSLFDEKTLNECAQMFQSCGNKAYEYLLDQGFPFPSYRTVLRHIMLLKKDPKRYEEFLTSKRDKELLARERKETYKLARRARIIRQQDEINRQREKNGEPLIKRLKRKEKDNTTSPEISMQKKNKLIRKKTTPKATKAKKHDNKEDNNPQNVPEIQLNSDAICEVMNEPEISEKCITEDELQASVNFLKELEENSNDSIEEIDSFDKDVPAPSHVVLAFTLPKAPVPKENLDKTDYFL